MASGPQGCPNAFAHEATQVTAPRCIQISRESNLAHGEEAKDKCQVWFSVGSRPARLAPPHDGGFTHGIMPLLEITLCWRYFRQYPSVLFGR